MGTTLDDLNHEQYLIDEELAEKEAVTESIMRLRQALADLSTNWLKLLTGKNGPVTDPIFVLESCAQYLEEQLEARSRGAKTTEKRSKTKKREFVIIYKTELAKCGNNISKEGVLETARERYHSKYGESIGERTAWNYIADKK